MGLSGLGGKNSPAPDGISSTDRTQSAELSDRTRTQPAPLAVREIAEADCPPETQGIPYPESVSAVDVLRFCILVVDGMRGTYTLGAALAGASGSVGTLLIPGRYRCGSTSQHQRRDPDKN
jgi:hypothetical protein